MRFLIAILILGYSSIYGQENLDDSISFYQKRIDNILGVDYGKTIDYHRKVIAFAKQRKDSTTQLIYEARLSYYLTYDGHYDEARNLAYDLQQRTEGTDNKKLDALVYKGLGFYHRLSGNLDIAQEYYDRAITSAIASEDPAIITDLMTESSKMEFGLERYENSLRIAQDVIKRPGLSLFDSTNVGQMLALGAEATGNDSLFNLYTLHYEDAFRRFSLEGEWKAYDLLSKKYKKEGNVSARKRALYRMLEISEQIGNREAKSMHRLGDFYYDTGDIERALIWHEKGYRFAKNTDRASDVLSGLNALYKDYKKSGPADSALVYYEQYVNMRNTFFERQSQDRIIDRDKKLELQQKEAEIEALSAIKRKSDERQRLLLLGLIALSIISVISLIAYNKIRSITARLRKTNKDLKKAWHSNSTLLKETHHRIKNNLQVISSLINLQRRYVADPAAQAALLDGRNRIKSVSLVHELLYRYDVEEGVNMKDYIERIISGLFSSYKVEQDDISFENNVEPLYLAEDNVHNIGLIVNEIVTNALKYAFPENKGIINVLLQEKENHLLLEIADNGIGMPEGFSIDENKKSFGYTLIQSLVNKMNAQLEVTSEGGTHFKLKINNYQKVEEPDRRT